MWCIEYKNITDGCRGIIGPFDSYDDAKAHVATYLDKDSNGKHYGDHYSILVTQMNKPKDFKW